MIKLTCTLSGVLLGVLLFQYAHHLSSGFDPLAVGMGMNTQGKNSYWQNIFLSPTTEAGQKEQLKQVLPLKKQGKKTALILGASQTFSINHLEPNQEPFVYHLNRAKSEEEPIYFLGARPNGNLFDQLSILIWHFQNGHIPNFLILPFVHDDFREPGIQRSALEGIDPEFVTKQSINAKAKNFMLSHLEQLANEPGEKKKNPQQVFEQWLTAKMSGNWSAFAERGNVSGNIRVLILSSISKIFGNVMSRRTFDVKDKDRQRNLSALQAMLELAKNFDIEVFIYRQPIPQKMDPFYHNYNNYQFSFKLVKDLAAQYKAAVVDLESIVPLELWGLTNAGRLDVFHFREEGHKILAKHLQQELRETYAF